MKGHERSIRSASTKNPVFVRRGFLFEREGKELPMMSPERKGRLGEVAVVQKFLEDGYDVFTSAFGSQSCDMVVVKGDEMKRVEVKSTNVLRKSGKYSVYLCSSMGVGDRRSFDGSKSDVLAVYVQATGRIHLLDSKEYHGRKSVNVAG